MHWKRGRGAGKRVKFCIDSSKQTIIRSYLTGLSGIFPFFIPAVEAVRDGAVGTDGGRDGVVVEEADMVTTVVAEAVTELKEGMVTS